MAVDRNSKAPAAGPYAQAGDYAFWRRAVARVPWNFLDPMVGQHPIIGATTRVASAGSCFAQNVARYIRKIGYNYYVVEPAADGITLFSAQYGNIYTIRQQLQLFKQAYGDLGGPDFRHVWKRREDSLFVDALRSQTATPFAEPENVIADRLRHLACVKTLFETAEVFIFTLGLTECWLRRDDGLVHPVAPGVMNRDFDPDAYVFKNMSVSEVTADLDEFIACLRGVNPGIAVVLTVSPVPLIATYEKQHVLAANCYSKSVLRVAADEACRNHANTFYFPAYEIFTGAHAGGRLYERDKRAVTAAGVNLAMRLFFRHFSVCGDAVPTPYVAEHDYQDVVCEPEMLSFDSSGGEG